jgi:hypothetical protein
VWVGVASLGNWVVAPSFGRVYDSLIFKTGVYGSFSHKIYYFKF